MLYNLLIDWEDQTEESGITEPLTVQEVKNYLRLEGFIDNSESISSDFDDDDVIIENSYENFIALSRYARWISEDNRRETWGETVDRYFAFMLDYAGTITARRQRPEGR